MRISDCSSDVCSSDLSILRRLYQRCEEIYAPSESMAAVLHDQRMSRHIAIWSRGIDRQLFHPGRRDPEWRRSLGIADDEAVVLFVGRLVLEKGQIGRAHV